MKWWELLGEICIGTVLFVAVGIPAVGLDLLVQWLPTLGVSSHIIFVLTCLKWVLLWADVFLFVLFILTVVWRAFWKL